MTAPPLVYDPVSPVGRLRQRWREYRRRRDPGPLLALARRNPAPDSREPWQLVQGSEILIDDEYAARRSWNVWGQVLDPSVLEREERAELPRLLELRGRVTPDQELRRRQLLARTPRLTAPGVDLDVADHGAASEARRLIDAELDRRGVVVRWSWSGGPGRPRLHGDLGACEPGAEHPALLRALLGWWRDVLAAAGFERADRVGVKWRLPCDDGSRGEVDLTPLNRDPGARGSLFRPLGGEYKDGHSRKTLCPDSPSYGSPITEAHVAEGLELHGTQERAAGRGPRERRRREPWRGHAPPEGLPGARRLPHVEAWIRDRWSSGTGQQLRLEVAGALLESGLVREGAVASALSSGTGNATDSRSVAATTAQRLRAGQPISGAGALRRRHGTGALWGLAWALWQDLAGQGWSGATVLDVWRRLGGERAPYASDLQDALGLLDERAGIQADDLDGETEPETPEAWLSGRLRAAPRCGQLALRFSRCNACSRPGAPRILSCGAREVCGQCAARATRDYLEALRATLPRRSIYQLHCFATRDEARKVSARIARAAPLEHRPHRWIGPAPGGGGWLLLCVLPAGRAVYRVTSQQPEEEARSERPDVVLSQVARVLMGYHVAPRERHDAGDAAGFAALAGAVRRARASVSRAGPFRVPTRDEVRELGRKRAQERAEARGEHEDDGCCPGCPADLAQVWKNGWDLLEAQSGRLLRERLARPLGLVEAVALLADGSAGDAVPEIVLDDHDPGG